MRRWIGVRGSRFLAALMTVAALTCAAAAQDRVALVVGNSKYVSVNGLANASNDARAMARTLRAIGFDVAEGFDLDRSGMERQLREFLRSSANARVALFFYAGHGLQVDGRNYLLPVDTKLESPGDLSFETIGLDNILENLSDPSRTNIIILDACRNNPFANTYASRFGAARSVTVLSGLAGYSNLGTGTLIAFSTAPGAVAASPRTKVSAVGPVRYSLSVTAPASSAARSVSEFLTTLKVASASRSFARSSAICGTLMPR